MPHVVDETLTQAWCEIYEALRQGWKDFDIGPSQRELRRATGYSTATIYAALKALKRAGYIVAPKHTPRSAKPVDMRKTLSCKAEPKRMPWEEVAESTQIWDRYT